MSIIPPSIELAFPPRMFLRLDRLDRDRERRDRDRERERDRDLPPRTRRACRRTRDLEDCVVRRLRLRLRLRRWGAFRLECLFGVAIYWSDKNILNYSSLARENISPRRNNRTSVPITRRGAKKLFPDIAR